MTDGNLAKIFSKNLPHVFFQRIETWGTGQGVPDTYYCANGHAGWIEFKATKANKIEISPHQIAWHERHFRHHGQSFIAIRKKVEAGPRRGEACDELWLFYGFKARSLASNGLEREKPTARWWFHGPSKWDWDAIARILQS